MSGVHHPGTPLHAFPHRADNKLYRIQNPQRPLVHTHTHDMYHSTDYPAGANAVVAVISYTGLGDNLIHFIIKHMFIL